MDDLDQLISDALTTEGASGDEPTDELTPESEEATELEAEGEEVEESTDDPANDDDAEPSDSQPDADPEGTGEQESEPDVVQESVDVDQLRRENELQKRILANFVNAKQRQQQEAAEAERQRQQQVEIEALRQQWAEMDPEDAARHQAAFIAQKAEEQIRTLASENEQLRMSQQQAEQMRQEAEAKSQVVPLILKKFDLKESDRRFIERLNDPYAMEELAADLKQMRQEQTANARKAKAEKVKANPALKATEPSKSAPVFQQEHENIDQLLDALFPG